MGLIDADRDIHRKIEDFGSEESSQAVPAGTGSGAGADHCVFLAGDESLNQLVYAMSRN